MSDTSTPLSERDEVELLLPWYATGRLDATDLARVERWLAHDAQMMQQLALLEDDRQETVRSNETLRLPPSMSVRAAMTKIVAPNTLSIRTATATGLIDQIRSFFAAPQPVAVRWAAAAITAVILTQAIWLGSLLYNREPPQYQTASGSTQALPAGTFALVRFVDTATIKDIAAALTPLDMSITDGPKPGNLFRIRIGTSPMGEVARTERIAALRALTGLVQLATPTTEK